MAGAGVDLRVRLGDAVRAGEPLYRLHARFDADLGLRAPHGAAGQRLSIGAPGELPREFVGGGDLS